ncbi:unnamed protein product [Musa acuminata subsp. burmannicoides]
MFLHDITDCYNHVGFLQGKHSGYSTNQHGLCGLVNPPWPEPLRMERGLIRGHHQQQSHQHRYPPRRALRTAHVLLPRPRQLEHEPPVQDNVAGDEDERHREEEQQQPESGLGAPHLRPIVHVPRHGQEEDDDGEDGDELWRREGDGGQRLLRPPALPWRSPLGVEPRHGWWPEAEAVT